VVDLLDDAVKIAAEAKSKTDKLKDYKEYLAKDKAINEKMDALRKRVEEFASVFPIPGFDEY